MIHIDRNHHSPLSNSSHSKQNLILPNQHSLQIPSPWADLPQRPPNSQSDGSKQPQDQKRDPATPPEGDPVTSRPSGPESPASPADGNSTSPTADERSSSLSPVPETTIQAEQNVDTADTKPLEDRVPSCLSTPLSELSPPPDDMDTPAADTAEPSEKKESGESKGDDENAAKSQAEVNGVNSPNLVNFSSQQLSSFATSGAGTDGGSEAHLHHPSLMNHHSPMPGAIPSAPTNSSEQRVAMMLELNSELIKVSMEFQARGIQFADSRFQQYAARIKSNLDYMARWADNTINPAALPPLPIIDAPPPVEFTSTERVQQLYSDLATVFAKALAQRNQLSSATPQPMTPITTLKRERSEDIPLDMMNKRRDTGENKMLNSPSMMPPPSLPQSQQQENQYPSTSSTPIPNGMTPLSAQSQSAQMSDQVGAGGPTAMSPPGMMNANEAQMTTQRQAAMRLQQQRQNSQQGMSGSRQMSPPSSGSGGMNQQISGGGMQNQMNGTTPSHPQMAGGGAGLTAQQAYTILNTPNHPFVGVLMKQVPGFATLPIQDQMRKISQLAAIKIQEHQHQQQQNAMNMGRPTGAMPNMSPPMNNVGMGGVNTSPGGMTTGMGMPGNQFSNPQQVPPVTHQAQMAQNPMMIGQGGSGSPNGMDPQRSMTGTPQLGGMSNSPMHLNQMTQRQLMLMQQQQQNRGGGNMGGGSINPANMMMNPQQQMAFMQQQQERMRQQQIQQPPATSPTHSRGSVGSPMLTGNAGGDNNGFPPVLRSGSAIPGIARSARSPPDGGVQSPMTPRMPNRGSMNQDDFTRMMMQQQQGGQQRGMQPQNGFNPQQMQASSNWQQQQQIGLTPSSYGMNNRPGSAAGFVGGGSYGGGVGGGGQGSNNGVVGGGSPPGLSQTWGTPNNPNASYPFATPSPGHQSDLAPTRHMSATPAPGQQPMQAPNMISPTSADPFLFANDFSFPNWTQ
ncbi:hypothetical protein E1B28_003974 [Marasmius oreades]|uniref:SS18 N-terminal domain-containing protein n=1 Tax=Marasmius oreades TaxID=181124 RepID=A0A9P8AC05_9AGAR|nr:uncharacterized protein E1B28_003974 [Marasmius oreades]KAG7096552.1 hypothetical protein E1B28_003974 [Marasmius oreades]